MSILFDARSPSEFRHAHIPGAFNLPLLDDEHRIIVGTTYKQQGREAAVLKGFDLVGPKFGDLVRQAKSMTEQREITVYCWRGGMRSGILSWVLNLAGFKVTVLKGGYKAYRNRVLSTLREPRQVIIVGGKTGSGKTEVLEALRAKGEQVIDLEAIANHKGSAFGALGQEVQPSVEQSENELAKQWELIDPNRLLWLENESRSIGKVKINDAVFELMRTAPVVEVNVSIERRKQRILADYGRYSKEELAECTSKLNKRLGGLRMQEALSALQEDRMSDWLDILLQYYDKTYGHGNELRREGTIHSIDWPDELSSEEIATALMERASRIQ
jgi:tRNA 2-selenouridine synthase